MAPKELKSWFSFGQERNFDRTLKQQLKGLGMLRSQVAGKTVLDIGCAEGLISIYLVDHGAVAAHGIDTRSDFIEDANRLRGDRPCTFEVADANVWEPQREYDVVIMLAVLHKLEDPGAVCKRFAAAARDLVVIRIPPKDAPRIVDERSDFKPVNIDKVMRAAGFKLSLSGPIGPHGEWMGYYERPDRGDR